MFGTDRNISDTGSENVEGNEESEVGETERTMLCVKFICECGNESARYSQPVNGKQLQGNALIASELLLSGILFEPFLIRNKPVWLAGDGQYDSPGFSAKYFVYSLMDLDTGLVVDFELVQKGMIKDELERATCENIMEKFVNKENCN
ncbi:hypothetical protein PR048_013779, partial [Dryococelus australis]